LEVFLVIGMNLRDTCSLFYFLGRSAAGGADGPDRVFVGGLPYYLAEVQIKELLESFG
jgi:hypothetical protein